MSGVNKVILVGYCGKDPETKHLEGDKTVSKFSLATSETYKDKQGNKQESTEWHNIVAWGKLAEIAEKYVKKGTLLYVEGKIKTRTYGEGDAKKYFTEVVADSFTMLGGKKESGHGEVADAPAGRSSNNPDDLPF